MLALLDSVDTVTRASLATPCILTTEGAGYIPDYGIKYTRLADALHSDGSPHWAFYANRQKLPGKTDNVCCILTLSTSIGVPEVATLCKFNS